MRRALTVATLAVACLLLPSGAANAHPLGNFSVNRFAGLRVQPTRVLVYYVVDMAEIPAFQARDAIDADRDGRLLPAERAAYAARMCAEIGDNLTVSVGGRGIAITADRHTVSFPPGAAGLATMRVGCDLSGSTARGDRGVAELRFHDANFPGRVGWREVTAVGDGTTLVGSDVPATSVSAGLTRYPEDLLVAPLNVTSATLRFRRGGVAATSGAGEVVVPSFLPRGVDRVTAAFTSFLARRSLTLPLAALALVLAVALGALHALAPGHGKTVIAAYLVGKKGSAQQGVLMGLTVTATHTAGVLILGVLLTASTAFAVERLYPLLGVASGVLLSGIGAGLLRRAIRSRRADRTTPHPHDHAHMPAPKDLNTRSLLGLGLAGGLVPSPSALVVLLGAIALGRTWFGVALVVAYGLGMASTLAGAGLLLVKVRDVVERRGRARRPRPALALLVRAIPLATAATITVIGLSIAARGASQI